MLAKAYLPEENNLLLSTKIHTVTTMQCLPTVAAVQQHHLHLVGVYHNAIIALECPLTVDIEVLVAQVEDVVFGQDAHVVHGQLGGDQGEFVADAVLAVGFLGGFGGGGFGAGFEEFEHVAVVGRVQGHLFAVEARGLDFQVFLVLTQYVHGSAEVEPILHQCRFLAPKEIGVGVLVVDLV